MKNDTNTFKNNCDKKQSIITVSFVSKTTSLFQGLL